MLRRLAIKLLFTLLNSPAFVLSSLQTKYKHTHKETPIHRHIHIHKCIQSIHVCTFDFGYKDNNRIFLIIRIKKKAVKNAIKPMVVRQQMMKKKVVKTSRKSKSKNQKRKMKEIQYLFSYHRQFGIKTQLIISSIDFFY